MYVPVTIYTTRAYIIYIPPLWEKSCERAFTYIDVYIYVYLITYIIVCLYTERKNMKCEYKKENKQTIMMHANFKLYIYKKNSCDRLV